MGLTAKSMGTNAFDAGLKIHKDSNDDKIIALAGNPNVGKSTVFNALTGMKQHTGNWPGKTVTNTHGVCKYKNSNYIMVDIPGTYSLMAHSREEEVARDFICFGEPDYTIIVCDATCLERNMNLVLQTIEITDHVVVCVNLMDEAEKKHIKIDLDQISQRLGVPVIGTSARHKRGIYEMLDALSEDTKKQTETIKIKYTPAIEQAIDQVCETLKEYITDEKHVNIRWTALRLLEGDQSLNDKINDYYGSQILNEAILSAVKAARQKLEQQGIDAHKLQDNISSCLVLTAEWVCCGTIEYDEKCDVRDRKIDRILTGKWTGVPIMIILLGIVFWITITGANYPSELLSNILFWFEDRLVDFSVFLHIPPVIYNMLIFGVYRVLAWVVSVMLPPMAIFFPLFTLLEDLGYLPRIAFNLDKCFKRCSACGKQALTTCMGFGCNAAGVVGCRIIDSPRERLIAMITNSFVPCNGRFPIMIAMISMFFVTSGAMGSFVSAALLTAIILFGILMTFIVSKLLSLTLLKGEPSSFTLELPPYRKPQIGKIVVRSIFDRTLFVLGRAVAVAAPAGLIIWLLANIQIGDATLLIKCAEFLDPFGKMLGMDGVIILAFILGLPANEIVIPIIIMAYMATGSITEFNDLIVLKTLLVDNGWTWATAISVMLFSLMHWPCSTTCMTIKKESGSLKWTAVSFLIPTIAGIVICFVFNVVVKLIC